MSAQYSSKESQGHESQEKTEKLRRSWRHVGEMQSRSWNRKRDVNGKTEEICIKSVIWRAV